MLPRQQGSDLVFYVVKLDEVKMDPLPPKPGTYDKFAIHYRFPIWENFTTVPNRRVPLGEKLLEVLGVEATKELLIKYEIKTVALRCKNNECTLVAECGAYTFELCTTTDNPQEWRLEKLARKKD